MSSFLYSYSLHAHLSIDTIQSLIATFGPLFKMHPTDESSPTSVKWMLDHSSLNVRFHDRSKGTKKILDRGSVTATIVGNAPYNEPNHEGDYFLNLEGNKKNLKKGPGYDADNFSRQDCYVNVVERENDNVVLQFWCFYAWQGSIVIAQGLDYFLRDIGYHEGDWEHVNIYLSKTDSTEIGYEISQIFFARHQQKKGDLVKKGSSLLKLVNNDLQEDKQGTHPVVYVAKNSHGVYPNVTRLSADVDQTSDDGPLWKSWEHGKYMGTLSNPQPEQEWIRYWGRWGSTVEATKFGITYHGDSPESPFLYGSFMHQGAHKKNIEIEGQKGNHIPLQSAKRLRKSKRYSDYFTFDALPKRIRILEWELRKIKKNDDGEIIRDAQGNRLTEPLDAPITYEVWEKKTFFNDKKIFGPFKSDQPQYSPPFRIKNMYIANLKHIDGRDYILVDDIVVVIKVVED